MQFGFDNGIFDFGIRIDTTGDNVLGTERRFRFEQGFVVQVEAVVAVKG
jgi:hypothetical protein